MSSGKLINKLLDIQSCSKKGNNTISSGNSEILVLLKVNLVN